MRTKWQWTRLTKERKRIFILLTAILSLSLYYLMVEGWTKEDLDIVTASNIELREDSEKTTTSMTQKNNMSAVMLNRVRVMKEACASHGLDKSGDDPLHRPNPWEFFINTKHSLVWCNVFKSASTSWMFIFNVLAGYKPNFLKKTKKVPLTLAREKYPRPSLAEFNKVLHLKNVTSLIIGRNPFERLVSAYKDKIRGAFAGSFHDKMRRRITHKYRQVEVPKAKRLPPHLIPSFKEFIQFIVDEHREKKVPDMHWAPVYSFCNPCQIPLTCVAKMESLDSDTSYILERLGLTPDQVSLERRNKARDGRSASEVTSEYLVKLGKELYEELGEIYRVDFDIFGYSIRQFVNL